MCLAVGMLTCCSNLHKAAASCSSSSEAINRDEFTLSRISESLSGAAVVLASGSVSGALWPCDFVIGGPQSAAPCSGIEG